jgi:hypothetical protein
VTSRNSRDGSQDVTTDQEWYLHLILDISRGTAIIFFKKEIYILKYYIQSIYLILDHSNYVLLRKMKSPISSLVWENGLVIVEMSVFIEKAGSRVVPPRKLTSYGLVFLVLLSLNVVGVGHEITELSSYLASLCCVIYNFNRFILLTIPIYPFMQVRCLGNLWKYSFYYGNTLSLCTKLLFLTFNL